jgi:phosphoribosyl 1,2-cyclic phosphodiesterase
MKGFCPLASGSKGNSVFFGTGKTSLLIDAGLNVKNIQKRLEEIKVDLRDIDAILISHEHSDHILGLSSLALKYKIPIFANSDTASAIHEILGEAPKFKIFSTGETFEFGDVEIHPFSIQHDTLDPVAFTIKTSALKMGFCTDLGFATTLVKNNLKNCDYLYVEANHQTAMVDICNRSLVYKQRVLGRQGHLSNEQCGNLVAEIAHKGLKHIHLAHLSQECNRPELALEIVGDKLKKTGFAIDLSIAYQEKISRPIFF